MPGPIDWTGRRIGKLTVLFREGKPGSGRPSRAIWRVRCDCGQEATHPAYQFGTRGRQITACRVCRAPPCIICGRPVLDGSLQRRTCSAECHGVKSREIQIQSYHRRAADLTWRAERNKAASIRQRERIAEDPDILRRRARSMANALAANPELRERNRERARRFYAANSQAIQARRRARLDNLDPEALARWLDRMRAYSRAYAERRREEVQANPVAQRRYLDLMAEYRRRAALLKLMSEARHLIERQGDE